MTDIPSLIERMNSAIRAYEATYNGDSQACELLRDCADVIKASALSRLTVSPLPEGRVKEAIYLVKKAAIDTLFNGAGEIINPELLDDTARRILALAVPASPPPEEIADIIRHLGTSVTETEAAAALQRQAREIDGARHFMKRAEAHIEARDKRISELEAAAKVPLPEEIAGLIERLLDDDIVLIGASPTRKESAAALQHQTRDAAMLGKRISELEAAAKVPPSKEIAGLIERLHDEERIVCNEAAVALQQMAREIERLEDHWDKLSYENKELRARIAELEAERDKLSAELTGWIDLAEKWQDERDAIRAKTIEECAAFIQRAAFFEGKHDAKVALIDMANSIRALNQPEAGEGD